jgi:hypothetical protein
MNTTKYIEYLTSNKKIEKIFKKQSIVVGEVITQENCNKCLKKNLLRTFTIIESIQSKSKRLSMETIPYASVL